VWGMLPPLDCVFREDFSEEACVARKSEGRRGVCRVNQGLAPLEPKLVKNLIFMLRKPL